MQLQIQKSKVIQTSLQVLTLGLFLSLVAFIASAEEEEFVEGKDYRLVETEVQEELAKDKAAADADASDDADADADTNNKIKVVEFFNYACPHCYSLEPIIKEWLEEKEDDVQFVREAVPLRNAWVPLARAFYIAEEFDVTADVHDTLFRAIFEYNLNMQRKDLLEQLFVKKGVESEEFNKAYSSEKVYNSLRATQSRMRLLGLKGTPAIVVDEKYVVDTELADGHERMFEIVEYLVDKVRIQKEEASQADPSQSTTSVGSSTD